MKVVIIGSFPDMTKENIRNSFPGEWQICIGSPAEMENEIKDADVLIPEHVKVDAALLKKAPGLKLVQTGAGYDNVDLEACTRFGVQVCNASGINANAVAEHVMALILCWYKNIAKLDRFMKAHGDDSCLDYTGAEVSEKTIGIIGLGHVGKQVAEYCKAFHMRVLGYSYKPVKINGVEQRDLESLIRESDIISLHIPLKDSTRHMINADVFSMMKPDALLINTSRGAIIDEPQLVRALEYGEIGGACLDVFEEEPLRMDHPLRKMDNVILTPHTAGLPDGAKFHKKRYQFFVSNIERMMRNETPECCLNQIPAEE